MKKFIYYSLGLLVLFTGCVTLYSMFFDAKLFFIASFEFFSFCGLFIISAKQIKTENNINL